jgi:hypothetical protein
MRIGKDGITGSRVLAAGEVERRWRANPLDTTFPRIPWWLANVRQWCGCTRAAHHSIHCKAAPLWLHTIQEVSLGWTVHQMKDPITWMWDLPSLDDPEMPHQWYLCTTCGEKLGEVNHDAHIADCPQPEYELCDRW